MRQGCDVRFLRFVRLGLLEDRALGWASLGSEMVQGREWKGQQGGGLEERQAEEPFPLTLLTLKSERRRERWSSLASRD